MKETALDAIDLGEPPLVMAVHTYDEEIIGTLFR